MSDLFAVHVSVLELVVRGTATYWFLFLIFRFVMRRDVGAIGVADVLLLVIVADAAQNGMSGEYRTITEGFILVGTIVGWNWLLDYLSFRFKWARKFIEPSRLLLVNAGKPQQRNLARQFLTLDDLKSKLRQQGIESLDEVKRAFLEGDGEVSVIRYKEGERDAPPRGGKSNRRPVA